MSQLEKPTVVNALRSFHDDEDGIEAVQVVMILGIAAVVLIALWNFFPGIRKWVKDFLGKMGIGGGSGGGIKPDGEVIN
jgi:Flp pilus assembly pilin Flp